MAAFWANANLPKSKPQEEEDDDTVYVDLEFPLMYPEELAEFIEDVEESLQNIALSLSRFKPGANVAELAHEVAFFANKIRGAAELDGINWLAEVSGEMEQGMLLIEKDPREEGTPAIIAVYFRATDAIHNFLESIQGDYAHADATVVQDLHKSLAAYGVLEDIATQDKIGELIGALAEAEKPTGPVTLEGKHILLIDDDTVIRNTLERHLRSSQCVVEQAKNGAIGLDRLVGTMMDFDLVIVDLHMPIMDGFEFVSEVRKQSKYDDLPIIMFTASLHMADVRKAIGLGINGYVIKREWKNCLMPESSGPSGSLKIQPRPRHEGDPIPAGSRLSSRHSTYSLLRGYELRGQFDTNTERLQYRLVSDDDTLASHGPRPARLCRLATISLWPIRTRDYRRHL